MNNFVEIRITSYVCNNGLKTYTARIFHNEAPLLDFLGSVYRRKELAIKQAQEFCEQNGLRYDGFKLEK